MYACRAVAVACDESKLAPLVNEYIKVSETVRDLTDSWVGAIRKSVDSEGGAQKQNGKPKPIKRGRVKLSMLAMPGKGALGAAAGGMGGSGKDAKERFGAEAQDADEMEYNMWRMQSLWKAIEKEAVSTRKKVCCCNV